jgi:hypothetical protein
VVLSNKYTRAFLAGKFYAVVPGNLYAVVLGKFYAVVPGKMYAVVPGKFYAVVPGRLYAVVPSKFYAVVPGILMFSIAFIQLLSGSCHVCPPCSIHTTRSLIAAGGKDGWVTVSSASTQQVTHSPTHSHC